MVKYYLEIDYFYTMKDLKPDLKPTTRAQFTRTDQFFADYREERFTVRPTEWHGHQVTFFLSIFYCLNSVSLACNAAQMMRLGCIINFNFGKWQLKVFIKRKYNLHCSS